MPKDHPVDAYRQIFDAAMKNAINAKGKPCRTNCGGTPVEPGPTQTIRVMVVATNDAIAAYGGDMQALAELAVAESNQGYANSNVGINMELALIADGQHRAARASARPFLCRRLRSTCRTGMRPPPARAGPAGNSARAGR